MKLNKIPVLDKGYVAFVSSSLDRSAFLDIKGRYFRGKVDGRLLNACNLHLEIKCPLFVQLSISDSLLVTAMPSSRAEAYIPTVNEVAAASLESSELIANDIEQTTEALLLNPKAYKMDGCDEFVSQILCPISVYNTVFVSGSLAQWIEYANRVNLPGPIESYRKVIEEVVLGEYDFLWDLIGEKDKKDKHKRSRIAKNIQDKS